MASSDPLRLSTLQHSVIGAFSGCIEICIQQPTVAIKNALQEGRPLSWRPSHLYRGLFVNVASVSPINAVQFGANGFFGSSLTKYRHGSQLTNVDKMLAATLAGAASAIITCPSELLIIHQQKMGTTAGATLSKIGAFRVYKGFVPTVIREALYSCGYLAISPVLSEYLSRNLSSSPNDSKLAYSMVASVLAGVVSAVVTHPFDTIKTKLQSDIDGNTYRRMIPTAKALLSQPKGIQVLYAGFTPRALRIIGAVFILGQSREHLSLLFSSHHLLE